MSRVLLIDSEAKSIEDIKKILMSLDSQCIVETYSSLYAFEREPKSAAPEFFEFNLIIMDYQLAKFNEWEKKLTELRSKAPAQAVICFTSYDAPGINRKHILNLGVFNLLYKPFDSLILKESLNMALKTSEHDNVQIKPIEMKPQASTAYVGILKEVDIIAICDLGFFTQSESLIPINSFSKYYSKIFSHEKKQSVWAVCVQSLAVPNRPDTFLNRFHFVGIESPVLMKLRKHLQENKAQRTKVSMWSFNESGVDRKLSIGVVDVAGGSLQLKADIEKHFKNVTVDLLTYSSENPSEIFPSTYDAIINAHPLIAPEILITSVPPGPKPILLCDKALTDDQFKQLLSLYREIFRQPLDRSYFYKKLKLLLPDLQFHELPEVINITSNEKLKAANLVKISEICELYLVFTYHRELPKQSYREFAFTTEDENQMIQLPAFCSFTLRGTSEQGSSEPVFIHQFTFWGTTDHYLKQIRLWLLHNYIEKNQKESV